MAAPAGQRPCNLPRQSACCARCPSLLQGIIAGREALPIAAYREQIVQALDSHQVGALHSSTGLLLQLPLGWLALRSLAAQRMLVVLAICAKSLFRISPPTGGADCGRDGVRKDHTGA